jgi:hypothetical protein
MHGAAKDARAHALARCLHCTEAAERAGLCAGCRTRKNAAERALKRARSTLATLRTELADALDGCQNLVAQSQLQRRVLRRLAEHHLGGNPTEGEVTQLIIRWTTEDRKLDARAQAFMQAQMTAYFERLFGGRREDDDG